MNLQFGCDKCEKLHIGKTKNKDICPKLTIDSWKQQIVEKNGEGKVIKEIFAGKEIMKDVDKKKYLGDIVANDGTNALNIKNKTNKAMGNVNEILTTLSERALEGIHLKQLS